MTLFPTALPDWQRTAGEVPSGALLRRRPEDFRVTEELDVEFSGEGEHDWLWIRKNGANTAWVARQLARFAGVPPRDVGYSGLKDRHAITLQWFSVRRGKGSTHDWRTLDLEGVEVLRIERHGRKLRTGTHRRNAFEITLTDCEDAPLENLERAAAAGVPNYFGEQRFGRDGSNLIAAEAMLRGQRMKREQRSLALSAARSYLFNCVLEARVRAGTWNRLEDGDVAMLAGSRSHFSVETVDDTLAARCDAFDVHPGGPLWGRGSVPAGATERAVLASHAELAALLERHADGGRRATRLVVHDFSWDFRDDELTLAFALERGAFATAVVREIVRYRDAAAGSAAP